MGITAPLRSANRWLWSTARRVGEGVGYVAAMPGRLLREAALHAASQPRIRRVVRDLLKQTPGLRLRVKRLVMGTPGDNRSAWQQRAFGPPAVARMPPRVHSSSAESTSRELSKGGSSRFVVAESMQPIIDVEEVGARIRRPRR
jgi:hypothetical protein